MSGHQIVVDGLGFGEGPRWRDGALWLSDIGKGQVMRWTPGTGPTAEVMAEVPHRPSGLGFLPNGDVLVVSMFDRTLRAFSPGAGERLYADLAELTVGQLNDMVVTPDGHAYVGSTGFDTAAGDPFAPSNLVHVPPDGAAAVVAEEMMFPNGTVVVASGGKPDVLVVAESAACQLTAFDIDDDGALSNRRAWAHLEGVSPDGICLDADGAIWVANGQGTNCLRVCEGGHITDDIDVGRNAFACALADDVPVLYVVVGDPFGPDILERDNGQVVAVTVTTGAGGSP
ncbi:MAG: SMP-30/gluconolactonase/LRE family protein [Actinomycetota bacterium]